MPLSWNEIKTRALAFSKTWANAGNENAEAKLFLADFFEIFGITNKRIAAFEHAVIKYGGNKGYIDLFWPGILLVEMKSRGKSLDRAYTQAIDYFSGIKERDLPRLLLVCDFARFRLHNLTTGDINEFCLEDLYKNIRLFGSLAGYQTQIIKPQDPINIRAAESMGQLHDLMKSVGYTGHDLELYLVRLLFCLFAQDTGIFEKHQFHDYIEQRTAVDGSDLACRVADLFQVLSIPPEKRFKNLDEQLIAFPYVNGKLFAESLLIASFDRTMRESLLDLCGLDWSLISPAIFGSLFQSIMDDKARRNLGAHYTSEENILKLIKPLFLDALWSEFAKIKGNKNKLLEFHNRLRQLVFLDPACGCGNFLVIAYRELRLLELAVLQASRTNEQLALDIQSLIKINVDQFYGIEIAEFPAQIAQVALWLTDHQMNLRISEEFGRYFIRIPLVTSANIIHGNALRMDWNDLIAAARCSYVLGNPPFVGHQWRNAAQMEDMENIWGNTGRFKRLDYVTCWYRKTADYMQQNRSISCALVSTNSICQGEQVGTLWGYLMAQGITIHFAHRTFAWSNEAKGKAAVHCIIIGFALHDNEQKLLFEYEDIKGAAHVTKATNINPYLIDAPNIILPSRVSTPIGLPQLIKGSQPTDGGHLILTATEKTELLQAEPAAEKWLRPYIGGEELINGSKRWCLWLKDIQPNELKAMPKVMQRVKSVQEWRLTSLTASVRTWSAKPTLFTQDRQPTVDYMALPQVSSEIRRFIPIEFLSNNVIASNQLRIIVGATLYHFGIMNSTMHNAWVRLVCGRLKSDYRYEPAIYNNYPWPEPNSKQQKSIEALVQGILDARAAYPQSNLAQLYDPISMPPALLTAHQKLDKAVDAAYGYKGAVIDTARVAFLFELYQKLTSLLPTAKSSKQTRS